jgi:hypothetical protein
LYDKAQSRSAPATEKIQTAAFPSVWVETPTRLIFHRSHGGTFDRNRHNNAAICENRAAGLQN